jgi:hypothetical protein
MCTAEEPATNRMIASLDQHTNSSVSDAV